MFSEKGDSKKRTEPKFPEIIDIADDDDDDVDDKVDQRNQVANEIKREHNTDDDNLKHISTTKRKRVSNERMREHNTKREHHGESAKASPFFKKTELDSLDFDSDSDSDKVIDRIYMSSLVKMKKQKERWEAESDMVKDFEKDDELCLNGVCALYRQKIIVHGTDLYR